MQQEGEPLSEDEENGMWRVWVRSKPDEFFREAFKDHVKRSEMIKTIRLAKLSNRDIKVINITNWRVLSPEEIQQLLEN